MQTISLQLPRPHEAQQRIKSQRKRFNVVPCGRRFGKTTLGIDLCIEPNILQYPVAWFSPSYKDMLEVWRECLRLLGPIVKRKNATERRIENLAGGVLEFWSLDNPDAGRGRKYRRVIVDEAGLVQTLMESWNMAIRPTLADYQGDAYFFGTPKGRNGFWQMFQWGNDPEYTEWGAWQMPSSANPYIADSEIEAMKKALPERIYQQEIQAVFLDDAGGVFRNVMQCATAEPQERPKDGHTYCFGVDWGKLNDFTVITVLDLATNSVVKVDRFNQIDYNFQLQRLVSLYETFKPSAIYAESNSMGEALIDSLHARNLPVISMRTTNATKDAWIQALSIAFEREEITILNDPVIIGELQAFEAKRLPSGLMKYSAPEGMHDDTVMSLALAYQGVARNVELVLW